MITLGLILLACGVFCLCGAGFNWDWFMNHRNARFFTAILGRTGARVFYALLGIAFVVLGALATLGILQNGS